LTLGSTLSLQNLLDLVAQLEEKKIGFRSLQESMDTSSSGGKLIFHVFGALAEFERNLIRERTNAGLRAARARGRKGGRPKRLDEKKRKLAIQLYRERKQSIEEICQMTGISKPTLYGYVRGEPSGNQ
jgi:DNA invertase Pin-like site-specific DNA recombinase